MKVIAAAILVLVLVAAATADVIVEKRSGPSKGLLAALGVQGTNPNVRSLTKDTRSASRRCISSDTSSESSGSSGAASNSWESDNSWGSNYGMMSSASVPTSFCYQVLALVQLIFVMARMS